MYLDSIGTILVGVLRRARSQEPLTGGLANFDLDLRHFRAPFHSRLRRAVLHRRGQRLGCSPGVFGRLGFFRSRPNTPPAARLVPRCGRCRSQSFSALSPSTPTRGSTPSGTFTLFFNPEGDIERGVPDLRSGYFILATATLRRSSSSPRSAVRSARPRCCIHRGRRGHYRRVCRRLISAPISSFFFGGVTGSGTDLLVAAFQQAGSIFGAVVQQGPVRSDRQDDRPLSWSSRSSRPLRSRFMARFPQGERAVGLTEG